MNPTPDSDFVDGNALAGELSEVFAQDVTLAVGVCAHCGREGPLADTRVYTRAPGVVVRCRRCGEVLLTLVTVPGGHRLVLRGLSQLTFVSR